jgi:ribose/xylose/arabinose/galactoside ABC-type transport system permease subunit
MIRLEQGLTALKARGIVPQNLRTIGQDYGALIALVVLILFNLIFTKQFTSVIAITDLLVHVTPTLILGVGMTLVIATGGIDISVGSIMGLTANYLASIISCLAPPLRSPSPWLLRH